jgi:hypothetical protein
MVRSGASMIRKRAKRFSDRIMLKLAPRLERYADALASSFETPLRGSSG